MSDRAPVPQRLLDSVDESSVMTYVKDLDGRYLHVNQRYEEFFAIGGDDIRGRTDDELAPRQTIDGPRYASRAVSENEPLQLEYTVASFDGRPALAVWRFAVRGADSTAVAICAVAAPVADAALARRECDRLMTTPQELNGAAPHAEEHVHQSSADDHSIAPPPRAEADELRRRVEEAESALVAERARVEEAESALVAERARVEEAESALVAERARVEEADAELDAARVELTSVRGSLEAAEAATQREADRAREAEMAAQRGRERAEQALTELHGVRAELDAARGELESEREQRTHSEREIVEELRGELADAVSEARAQGVRAEEADAALQMERIRAEQSTADLNTIRAQLESAHAELESAHAELASKREQRTHSEREIVDDLRRKLEDAEAAAGAERARAERSVIELNATRAERDAIGAQLAVTRTELDAAAAQLNARRAEFDATGAQLNAMRAELGSARAELASQRDQRADTEQAVVDELRRKLQLAASTQVQEQARADQAEAALNAERADAEIRVGVAERRIAELEAALAEARADELEASPGHGAAGPHWDSSAQRAFTTALSQSSDWRVSVKSAIGVIGSRGGWEAVCAWQPDDRNGFASCFAMWTGENHRLSALETATWQRRQPLTGSTIGEALNWEDSQWLAADPRAADRRLQLLAQHGIRGALIVPVRDGVRPVAALELLTVGAAEPSGELVDAIETMALQLGHFSHLLSAGAQPRWRFGHV